MDLGLKDRAAIVTAASRGLGKAAAQALAREGANIALCSRTDQIFATAEEIQRETGVDVLAIQTDLTEPKQLEAMISKAHNHFQKIDILIINSRLIAPLTLTVECYLDLQDAESASKPVSISG